MIDWKKKTLAHWQYINDLAKRRFGATSFAEEAALYVVECLSENNWQRVKTFKGRARFSTYLSSLTYRLLEDFSRKRYGRVSPPLWIKKLGGVWSLLFTLLCLERFSIPDAVERSTSLFPACPREEIEHATYTIKERILNCGAHQGLEVEFDETALETMPQQESADVFLEKEQRQELFSMIFRATLESETHENECINEKIFSIHLTPQEKLLLRMKYVDNLSSAAIAALLGLTRHQVSGRLRRLLKRIKKILEGENICRESLRDHLR